MKRYVLLLTAALGMAAAQTTTPTPAQTQSTTTVSVRNTPADQNLRASPVTVNTGTYRGPLSTLLAALAKSAGYDAVFNFNVDALPLVTGDSLLNGPGTTGSTGTTGTQGNNLSAKPIAYALANLPFNQVWPLLMDIYELQYEVVRVGNGEIIRISQRPAQLGIELRYLTAESARQKALEFFGSPRYVDIAIRDNQGNIIDKLTQFDRYVLDSQTMRIVADVDTNRLIVGGTAEETNKIRSFISTVDIPKPTGVPQGRTIYTVKGRQTDVTALLTSQYPTLRATTVGESNQLVISGPQDQIDAALALLANVDRPTANTVTQQVYSVKGVQSEVVTLLRAQYPNLTVTPLGQTPQIVITGPQNQLDAALALLTQIDRAPEVSAADAPPVQPVQRIYSVRGTQADITALLGTQYPGLRVTPVGQTGQLILNGVPTQIDAALALLAEVDRPAPAAQAGPQIVQRVFQLSNASAEAVKATLEGTLARDLSQTAATPALANVPVNATDANGNAISVTVPTNQTTAAQAAQQAATQEAADRAATVAQNSNGATIIADKRTNTLIVRGTPDQVTQIAELIPQLDQVVPQINVQVRIQELTETAARTLGLDWKVNFGGFNVNVGSGGLGATFDPTQSLVGFNIFPSLTALENQGVTRRVYDGNISMQSGQRSLGSGTSAQNASSTAAASIKSGGRLELNIPSSSGNIIRQIDYGLNLDFFDPQVAPDGSITLRVRGQVSNIAGALPTTSVPNLLNFTNSEAQSTVTFRNGQTVLMSGLLGTTESRSNDGVPFLSSIPGIGAAFGKQGTNRTQTQLLVIITGSIVK